MVWNRRFQPVFHFGKKTLFWTFRWFLLTVSETFPCNIDDLHTYPLPFRNRSIKLSAVNGDDLQAENLCAIKRQVRFKNNKQVYQPGVCVTSKYPYASGCRVNIYSLKHCLPSTQTYVKAVSQTSKQRMITSMGGCARGTNRSSADAVVQFSL